ncbi:MAG: AAA family ATPase, partial [Desulfobacterales bacterium]|nr:AAA family ATPase [Desulfobacterales bacterium]
MRKKFNDTGLCTPERHYMVDISRKIEQIVQLVEEEEYFSINRPRQFGKTTILSLLAKTLNQGRDCIALCISLEDMDEVTCRDQGEFISVLLSMFIKEFEFLNLPEIARFIKQRVEKINNMHRFSELITKLVKAASPEKSLVLMIDEVDKSSNNQLFLDFLGMLRKKYLLRNEGKDFTFQSIILAGVHDIKSLKLKIRAGGERKFNSPWNIAVDFEVDLSFNSEEIATMLVEYSDARQITPDIPAIADKLYYYTSGYPFLVSKLCKFMDEKISSSRDDKNWRVADVDEAFKLITAESYTTTLFDSLTKNLENNP